jgi:plastocyanin
MRTLILSLIAAFALTGLAVAQASAPSPAPAPATVVHIKDFAFAPADVTIKAGDTVRFVQDDETAHTVTAADKSFDSGNLDRHATWSHTFATAGTYAYMCSYHTYMKGTVIVK